MIDTETAVHLHRDDVPDALAVLEAVMAGRHELPGGYEPTDTGAWVDWDMLLGSWLSSTELACVDIARGLSVLERSGGANPGMLSALTTAFNNELTRMARTAGTLAQLRAATGSQDEP